MLAGATRQCPLEISLHAEARSMTMVLCIQRHIRKERRSRRRVLDKALLDIDDEDVTITGKQRQSIAGTCVQEYGGNGKTKAVARDRSMIYVCVLNH